MAHKIFLDANILLDFILHREHYDEAKTIFELISKNDVKGHITSSVLHICGYWVSKAYGATKAKAILSGLLTEVKIIDISHETALAALHSKIDDIEDALQYYTALSHKLDFFVSRDKKLKADSLAPLPVYTPFDFVKFCLT